MVNEVTGGIDLSARIIRWARPGKLTDSAGAIKQIREYDSSDQSVPANGDLFYFYFILDGTETKLNIGTIQASNRGIWRWKLNDYTEDTTDYDDYIAVSVYGLRYIDVTGKTQSGSNVLRLRVNGKNASSTDYYLVIMGASLQ